MFQQLAHQRVDALPAGLDDQVRDFPVQRIANAIQLLDARARIGGAQQWPRLVVARALPQVARLRVKIDDESVLFQQAAVGRSRTALPWLVALALTISLAVLGYVVAQWRRS